MTIVSENIFRHFDESTTKIIKRIMPYLRTDSYFYYIVRLIIRYDLEANDIQEYSLADILERYGFVTRSLLKRKLNIQEGEIFNHLNWEIHHENYSKEIDSYRQTLISYVIQNSSDTIFSDYKPDDYSQFNEKINELLQAIMYAGYKIAGIRVITSPADMYLSYELPEYDSEELVIYPTIDMMIALTELNDKKYDHSQWKKIWMNGIFPKIDIEEDAEALCFIDSDNKMIVKLNGNEYESYKLYGDFMNDFIAKKINRSPISSFRFETQINLRKKQ